MKRLHIRKFIAFLALCVWFGGILRLCGLKPFTIQYEAISIPAAFGLLWMVEKLDKIK